MKLKHIRLYEEFNEEKSIKKMSEKDRTILADQEAESEIKSENDDDDNKIKKSLINPLNKIKNRVKRRFNRYHNV